MKKTNYHYFRCDGVEVLRRLGKEFLLKQLERMLLIRHFETRAEGAYLQGKIGGFFHSYIGQEAVQTAAVAALGEDQWWITSYRCHALALLLGATSEELMAELFGKETGNAKGRGGSMHFFTKRLLGGFGIVGGQVPIATGAAFTVNYLQSKEKDAAELAVCFLGDGATAQGAVHESLNLASLWSLPCVYVVENNEWGMGTHVNRAISFAPIAERLGAAYGMKSYTVDGMDFFSCYQAFHEILMHVRKEKQPVIVEVIVQRFKGHSISDPGLYRSKDALNACMQRDPLVLFFKHLEREGMIDEKEYEALDAKQKEKVLKALEFAEKSPWPDPATLEDDVLAP
ncbi:MAG: pyruvate dehydrogenase component subunit alpha [Chlamydiota bacterium]|jgi:pyruvate dehydrogenase E1 component alpha subunit